MSGEPTLDELVARIPSALFKYSGLYSAPDGDRLEWMRALIVESRLFFPAPRNFNDPLDFKIAPTFDAAEDVIEAHWNRMFERRGMSVEDRPAAVKSRMLEASTDEWKAASVTRVLDAFAERYGTVCLATDPTNMLMWSYYANGHTGIAVRFSTDLDRVRALLETIKAQGADPLLMDVAYETDFPVCNFYNPSRFAFVKTLLGTKSVVWEREGEWRIVLPGKTGDVKIPPEMITGVVLGMRIDKGHEATIRGWLADRKPAVELLRVAHRPNSFQLELVPA
jgi:Protein of unknown function (DUF2971)